MILADLIEEVFAKRFPENEDDIQCDVDEMLEETSAVVTVVPEIREEAEAFGNIFLQTLKEISCKYGKRADLQIIE